jgi:hypothetical protein
MGDGITLRQGVGVSKPRILEDKNAHNDDEIIVDIVGNSPISTATYSAHP